MKKHVIGEGVILSCSSEHSSVTKAREAEPLIPKLRRANTQRSSDSSYMAKYGQVWYTQNNASREVNMKLVE